MPEAILIDFDVPTDRVRRFALRLAINEFALLVDLVGDNTSSSVIVKKF